MSEEQQQHQPQHQKPQSSLSCFTLEKEKPKNWCEICQIDFGSVSTCTHLRFPELTKRAQQKLYDDDRVDEFGFCIDYRDIEVKTVADDDDISKIDTARLQQKLFPQIERKRAFGQDELGFCLDYREVDAKTIAAAADVSKIDTARMQQKLFDDAVVEVALYNYEKYHGLPRGAATYTQVRATSAGILGWSACLLDTNLRNDDVGGKSESSSVATTSIGNAHKQPNPEPRNIQVKSDEKESLQLQMALLESIGAHPSALPKVDQDEDNDLDDNGYSDSDCAYDEEDTDDTSSCASSSGSEDDGDDINKQLFDAVGGKKEDEVARLLLQGADIKSVNKYGETPLHIASYNGNDKIARMLIDDGGDVNAVNKWDSTPLHKASEKEYGKIARMSIDERADVNAVDNDGSTPLHYASWNGYDKIARMLIDEGAEVNAVDNDGRTPLYLAKSYDRQAVVKLLEDVQAGRIVPAGQSRKRGSAEAKNVAEEKAAAAAAERAKMMVEAHTLPIPPPDDDDDSFSCASSRGSEEEEEEEDSWSLLSNSTSSSYVMPELAELLTATTEAGMSAPDSVGNTSCSSMDSNRITGGASVSSLGTGNQAAHQADHIAYLRTLTSTSAERKRTVAACRALRAQISRFEEAFVQLHGRPPKGAADRAPLATTYANYREWKRAIREDAACRIQALFRGARVRWM